MLCPSCTRAVSEGSRFCPSCGAALETQTSAPTETSARSTPPPSFDSQDEGRFLPGTTLGGRYRIVSLLGKGGMGEVYRADDLKLGQPVALKFLPETVQDDAGRLGRLLNEVKVALRVTHPNVCRVHDVGEVDGHHYLSMEYVDGEDLASLLKRIGRFPQDKAVQIARQLCAGVAAAHEQGILHRDLKPANVMIDGRGRAKITDFGLASLSERIEGAEARAGTPAYMAPEQISGEQATVKSDLYSLGLVLYELFTGKRAFGAKSTAELVRLRDQSAPTTPSTHVSGLDDAVERAILSCLERDPADRPASALAVAGALPGGDPLAAALAAGETPSPDMVAAAGPKGGLRPGIAAVCMAVIVAGIALNAVTMKRANLCAHLPVEKSRDVLRADAREIAVDLGYTEPPKSSYASFAFSWENFSRVATERGPGKNWDVLGRPGEMILYFNYRQSESDLVSLSLFGGIRQDSPPDRPGDVWLVLDLQGRLRRLAANPERVDWSEAPPPEADWSALFSAAGLAIADFEPTRPTIQPEVFADTRRAWSGVLTELDDRPIRIEAGSCRGRPVYFRTISPSSALWSADSGPAAFKGERILLVLTVVMLVVIGLVIAGAVFLAIRNLKLGRGDRKGALRLAGLVFALRFAHWIVSGHHVAGFDEIAVVMVALSGAIALALLTWVVYIALEPHVRRLWPRTLVAWNRLLAGRFRDPLVGRDVLVGLAVNAGLWFVMGPLLWAAVTYDWLPPLPALSLHALNGGRAAVGAIFPAVLTTLTFVLAYMILFLLLRIVLRRTWLAAAAFAFVLAVFNSLQFIFLMGGQAKPLGFLIGLLMAAIGTAVTLFLLLRFGFVVVMADVLVEILLNSYAFTADTTTPYFGTSLIGPLVILAIAIYAFRVSLAGRPLFSDA